MSNPNQLYLLADHIKLSLLERQRAQSLNIDGDSKDGHISRSLDQFRDGLAALETEQKRLEEAGDEEGSLTITDALPGLQKQYNDLTSQFHGFSSPSSASTLTHPNDPALSPDFEHATTTITPGSPTGAPSAPATSSSSTSNLRPKGARATSKTVRFSDNPTSPGAADPDLEAQLFGSNRYRDNPLAAADDSAGYRDEATGMTNTQIHAYHQRILDQQDEQLDVLGASIARQRELSMRIGDELDEHVAMLDDVDVAVDRHQGRLDGARRQVGRIARSAGESKQMIAIIILIIVLVLLIAILK
ncbi:v-SNARE [Annulohypoxylon truncatum]|uniref:v-SNARE n=1 Tax=Annulohypoxylon truncatum TaxID=327061 RepID=UPI002008C91F|nr:v-SNARE [Annulohypoxylon truncatum]KAI1213602.1 v-SNARE [Annulohypoxylon truncatum]